MTAIGFSQRVRWEWLDQAAELKRRGEPDADLTEHLKGMLGEHLSKGNDPERGNRDKAVSIIRKVWITPSSELIPLRDAGFHLLSKTKGRPRMAIHWGQVMAAYPFWGIVADLVGRLLALHDQIAPAHIQRRLREQFGERETVARATRRILSCFHDWGVLTTGSARGTYVTAPERLSLTAPATAFLTEALVWSRRGESVPVAQFSNCPALFPFRLDSSGFDLAHEGAGVERITDTEGGNYLRLRR
jgi:hypothetical protein